MRRDPFVRIETSQRAAVGWVAGLAAASLILRTFPPDHYAFYPPCPIHAVTGLLCPGCGGTRAISALLRGDFAGAWRLNVALVPLWLAYGAGMLRRMWRGGPTWVTLPLWVWICFAAVATGFTVWRNVG